MLFTRFPGRHRKNVYLYTTAGGDQDLPPVTPPSSSNAILPATLSATLPSLPSLSSVLPSLPSLSSVLPSFPSLLPSEDGETKDDVIKDDENTERVDPLQDPLQDQLENQLETIERMEKVVASQNKKLDLLQLEIQKRTEEISTLKETSLIQAAQCATQISQEIAVVNTQLKKAQDDLARVGNLYQDAQRDVNRLTRQFLELSDAAAGEKISNKGLSIEEILVTLRKDLIESSTSQTSLFKERQILQEKVLNLQDLLSKAQSEKEAILKSENKKTEYIIKEMTNELTQARLEIDAMRSQITSEKANANKKADLQKALKESEIKFAAFEKSCKDTLTKATTEAHSRMLSLETENTMLKASMEKLQSIKSIAETSVTKSEAEMELECNRIRREELELHYPYLKRQFDIYQLVGVKGGNNPDWISFVNENSIHYSRAKQIVDIVDNSHSTSSTSSKELCATLINIRPDIATTVSSLRSTEIKLNNLFEDLSGAVRVYVRIRPHVGGINGIDGIDTSTVRKNGKSVIFNGTTCGSGQKTYGRFFGVIPDTFTNNDVYSGCKDTKTSSDGKITSHGDAHDVGSTCCIANDASGMCRVFNQLSEGYHVILFGYGHSGSGKTLSLLGGNNGNNLGLAQLAIANLPTTAVQVRAIFESSYDKIDFRAKNFNSGKLISLYKSGKDTPLTGNIPQTMIVNEEMRFATAANAVGFPLSGIKNGITGQGLFKLKEIIDNYRLGVNRIMATPNNPQSSRTHLFICLEFQFSDGKTGYLTVVDMGGRESAIDILEMFLEKPIDRSWQLTSLLMGNEKLYPTYLKPHVFLPTDPALSWMYNKEKYRSDKIYAATMDSYVARLNAISTNVNTVIEVIKQSVFINETINQLTLFFKQKQNAGNSSTIKEHKFPLDEKRNPYDIHKFIAGNPTVQDRMGMYSILNSLSNFKEKPSKFVMLCNVRQETTDKFCRSTMETLDFANSIRST